MAETESSRALTKILKGIIPGERTTIHSQGNIMDVHGWKEYSSVLVWIHGYMGDMDPHVYEVLCSLITKKDKKVKFSKLGLTKKVREDITIIKDPQCELWILYEANDHCIEDRSGNVEDMVELGWSRLLDVMRYVSH